MNLVRLGHYHSPSLDPDVDDPEKGTCETALVVAVSKSSEGIAVNLNVWGESAAQRPELYVEVFAPHPLLHTFHLSADCPWKR